MNIIIIIFQEAKLNAFKLIASISLASQKFARNPKNYNIASINIDYNFVTSASLQKVELIA